MNNVRVRSRGRLPHWESDDAIYFVTFRLADSLPQHVVTAFKEEREGLIAKLRRTDGTLANEDDRRIDLQYSKGMNRSLDNCFGECYLANPKVAEIVKTALEYFDGKRYNLHAWCVMPNHVHLVLALKPGVSLAAVMHAIKRHSAKHANEILGRSGHFWQREYFDHIIRNEKAYEKIVEYVLNNPSKAGMKDWPFVSTSVDASCRW